MHLDTHIGERLKIVRKELGWSQQQAADAIGVRREMWAKYEAGAEPGAKVIAGMIGAGLDVAYILTGQRTALVQPKNPREEALLDNYRHCAEEDKAAIDRVVLNSATTKQQSVATKGKKAS